MTFEGYQAMNPEATQNVVLVNFRDDAPASAVDEVAAANYSPPGSMATPTSVRALERVTAAPFLFAVVMAAPAPRRRHLRRGDVGTVTAAGPVDPARPRLERPARCAPRCTGRRHSWP